MKREGQFYIKRGKKLICRGMTGNQLQAVNFNVCTYFITEIR
jgi:hypothetical protein